MHDPFDNPENAAASQDRGSGRWMTHPAAAFVATPVTPRAFVPGRFRFRARHCAGPACFAAGRCPAASFLAARAAIPPHRAATRRIVQAGGFHVRKTAAVRN